jgi:cell wall-associated NlpC family hydrolase
MNKISMKIIHVAQRWVALLVLVMATTRLTAGEFGDYEPQPGDVVFQSLGSSPLVDMIEGCTKSGYSHCGLVAQQDGKWVVIEAIGPVREIPLSQWIHNGRKDGFAAYRLKSAYAAKADKFVKAAYTYLGLPYDIHYEMDDQKIYCSELVFKAFRKATGEDLGRLAKLKDLDWKPYGELIKQIEGGTVPLEREIITPINLAKARQLERVYTRDITASTGDK